MTRYRPKTKLNNMQTIYRTPSFPQVSGFRSCAVRRSSLGYRSRRFTASLALACASVGLCVARLALRLARQTPALKRLPVGKGGVV